MDLEWVAMVTLAFSGMVDEIIAGTKTMTTRVDRDMRLYKMFLRDGGPPVLDIWDRNPRHRHPLCSKIGILPWDSLCRCPGEFFTTNMAIRDGFDTIAGYKRGLARLNEMTWKEVDLHWWTQIMWERDTWIDGPHPRKVA